MKRTRQIEIMPLEEYQDRVTQTRMQVQLHASRKTQKRTALQVAKSSFTEHEDGNNDVPDNHNDDDNDDDDDDSFLPKSRVRPTKRLKEPKLPAGTSHAKPKAQTKSKAKQGPKISASATKAAKVCDSNFQLWSNMAHTAARAAPDPRPRIPYAPYDGFVSARVLLREIFSDADTMEIAYIRWRSSTEGDVSFRTLVDKLWTLLFHGTTELNVVRMQVYLHLLGGFVLQIADLSHTARRILVALLEKGKQQRGEYVCAAEKFVLKTCFLRFASDPRPEEANKPLFDPRPLFLRFMDCEMAYAGADPVALRLIAETLVLFAMTKITTTDPPPLQRELLVWLVRKAEEISNVLLAQPAFAGESQSMLLTAWANEQQGAVGAPSASAAPPP